MADEPDNLTHVMLRDIGAKLDEHDARFNDFEAKVDGYRREVVSLARSAKLALGESTQTSVELVVERRRIDELFHKMEKLLSEQQPPSP